MSLDQIMIEKHEAEEPLIGQILLDELLFEMRI